MNFDVVIIGGGPAGLSAGTALARAGVKTALIERAVYPRPKTCAGIITEKTKRFLDDCFPDIPISKHFSTNHVSLLLNGKPTASFTTAYGFTLVERNDFDYSLYLECKKAGVSILDGSEISQFSPDTNALSLKDGTAIIYEALIAADGANSFIRKKLNLPKIQMGFCVQDSIEREKCPPALADLNEIQIGYGSIPLGYSWVVPNATHIVVGTGMLVKNFDWPHMLLKHEELCSAVHMPASAKRRGAFVPIGELTDYKQYPYENIVFVGDAAGLANPLTGEGIYLALLSGKYAGNAYLEDPKNFKTAYNAKLSQTACTIREDAELLPRFYEKRLLESLIYQFKDCPEYLASICDGAVSLEERSYALVLEEIEELVLYS